MALITSSKESAKKILFSTTRELEKMDEKRLICDQEQNGPIDLSIKSSETIRETRCFRTSNNFPGIQTHSRKFMSSESDGNWHDVARSEGVRSVVSPRLIQSRKFDKTFISVDSTAENTREKFVTSSPLVPATTLDSCPIVCDDVGKPYSLLEFSERQACTIPLDSFISDVSRRNYLNEYEEKEKNVDKSGNNCHAKLSGVNCVALNIKERCTYEFCTKKHIGHLRESKSSSWRNDRNLSPLSKNDFLGTSAHTTNSSSILHSNNVTKYNTHSKGSSQGFENERECEDSSEEDELPEDLSANKSLRHSEDLISRLLTTDSRINCNRMRKSASFCDIISRCNLEQQNYILDMSKSKSDSETPVSSPSPKINSSSYGMHNIDANRSLMEYRTLRFTNKQKYLKQKEGRQESSKSLTYRPTTLEIKGKQSDNLQYYDAEPLTSHNWCQRLATLPNDRNSFLKHLHQIVPCGYPWNVYEYYTYLVQMYHSHEAFKREVGLTTAAKSAEAIISDDPSSARTSQTLQSFVEDSPLLEGENLSCAAKKQPSRTLTGKHVKHGTGASPSVLLSLRQKIQERQKAKELAITKNVMSDGKTEETGRKRKKSTLSKHCARRNKQHKNKENGVK